MENIKSYHRKWNPELIFKLHERNYAILVLNRPLVLPPEFIIPLWNKAKIRITADGGMNRWCKYVKQFPEKSNVVPIDVVCGDFDSVTAHNLKFANDQKIEVIQLKNQDESDFTKSLRVLNEKNLDVDSVIVLCQSSGRLDQIFQNIHTLYKCGTKSIFKNDVKVYLLSNDSVSWLLESGVHKVTIPKIFNYSKNSWCGLIPIGEKCVDVTTTGLKWNLQNGSMEFGQLISTSNTFDGSEFVTIANSSPLLWCMNILPILHKLYDVSEDED